MVFSYVWRKYYLLRDLVIFFDSCAMTFFLVFCGIIFVCICDYIGMRWVGGGADSELSP